MFNVAEATTIINQEIIMFTEEQQAAIDALLTKQKNDITASLTSNFDQATKGLKDTNDALKAEKIEALELKKAAELAAAEEAGNHAEVLRLKEEQQAELSNALQAKLDTVNNKLISNDKDLAVSELSSHMINNDAAIKMLLSNMVKVSVSDSGELQKSFVDFNGQEVAKDVQGYLAWAATDATMRNYIKGSQASGGQAGGNNNHVQGRKNPKDMSSQERLEFKNQDPDGFKKAFNL